VTADVIPLRAAQLVTFPDQSPMANDYGIEPPEWERPTVDITGALDGFAVLIRGRRYRVFRTLTNASRVASALMSLHALGCLDDVTLPQSPEAPCA
jgi:hypothetical protein